MRKMTEVGIVVDLMNSMLTAVDSMPDIRHINKLNDVEDYYAVQMDGGVHGDQPRIFNRLTGRTLSTYITNSKTGGGSFGSYRMVSLQSDKDSKKCSVGDIVLRHFIGQPPPGYTVEHKDMNKLNNALDNLEWLSKSDQIRRQKPRENVGCKGCGASVTAIDRYTGDIAIFANASCAFEWVVNTLQRCTNTKASSGVVYILMLAKAGTDGRVQQSIGHDHYWKCTPEDEDVLSLDWRQVPPGMVRGNKTVFCSDSGYVRFNGGLATKGTPISAYLKVSICIPKKSRKGKDEAKGKVMPYQVHRLVAAAFCEAPPKPNDVVDHFDGDSHNNRSNNLGWISKSENVYRKLLLNATIHKIEPVTNEVVAEYGNYMVAVQATGITEGIGASVYSVGPGTTSHGARLVVGGYKFCNPARLIVRR